MTPKHDLDPLVRQFVEEAGLFAQSCGVGRVIGQIYALLYFSPVPMSLGQIQNALGISKGGASTAVRQLEQWNALKKVWVRGDRKDFFRANDWIGGILRKAIADQMGRKFAYCNQLMDELDAELTSMGDGSNGDMIFVRERFNRMRQLQKMAQALGSDPLVQKLLS